MKLFQSRSVWMGLLALLLVPFLSPDAAHAQDESSGPTRMAVLNVPGGGTEALHEQLGQIPDLEVLRQAWFIKQIQNRGFDPKGIMRRPEDLKWVMDGGNLDYVLFLAPVSEQAYEVRIVQKDGTVAKKFSVDRTPDGLSKSGAELVGQKIEEQVSPAPVGVEKLGGVQQGGQQQESGEQQAKDEELDPNELKAQAATEKSASSEAFSTQWLWATGGARFMQRGFNVVGSNAETLSYQSSFYAGLHLNVEAFPFGMASEDYQAVGLYVDFRYGGDKVNVLTDSEAAEPQPLNIAHTEFSSGIALRGENPAKDSESTPNAHTRLTLGFKYVNLGIDPNLQLPSVSHIHLTIGGKVDYPFLVDGLYASLGAELTPVGFFGKETEVLFGESSSSYGMSGEVGLIYKFSDAIGLSASYDARVFRTIFEGAGEANFANANAFELVQGFTAGLQYHY